MKALILAAGLGTRLRPLTDTVPKALVPISGKPLLAYHLDSLKKHGVDEVIINTHYLADKISEFVDDYSKENCGINITTVFEPTLLGSAGTLLCNRDFFRNERSFFVVYGDNLTNINYSALLNYHEKNNGIVTISAYYEDDPSSKGIIVFDEIQKILRFIEKPAKKDIISNYANAGVYAVNERIFNLLKDMRKTPLDFGHDVFPSLLSKNEPMYAYKMSEFLLDVGTAENYERAQKEIKKIIF
jgi:mannose-1-phosphate guanylyltransferase